jgi:hypothetical protein
MNKDGNPSSDPANSQKTPYLVFDMIPDSKSQEPGEGWKYASSDTDDETKIGPGLLKISPAALWDKVTKILAPVGEKLRAVASRPDRLEVEFSIEGRFDGDVKIVKAGGTAAITVKAYWDGSKDPK